jgi:hypothetical protein
VAHGPPGATFVLVHSPIVGPDTWHLVAAELTARARRVVVPELSDDGHSPLWRQQVAAVVGHVAEGLPAGERLVLAAHSGAGQLLGHIGAELRDRGYRPVGYLHVDAGVATGGTSRLEQLRVEAPGFADELESLFERGERFPAWSDELLTALVPDPHRRRTLVAGIRRQPFDYWTEEIPPDPSDDTPHGVLLLSGGYGATEAVARREGWPIRDLAAGNHFHLLVDPGAVADELLALERALTAAR